MVENQDDVQNESLESAEGRVTDFQNFSDLENFPPKLRKFTKSGHSLTLGSAEKKKKKKRKKEKLNLEGEKIFKFGTRFCPNYTKSGHNN